MNKPMFLIAMLLAATALTLAQSGERQGTTEKPFVAGGHIRLQLSAADYEIRAGSKDRIVVSWRLTGSSQDATAKIEVNGGNATITTDGPHSNVHFSIEVPRNSDLWVRLGAGDLTIGAINGNKDIDMGAGDLRIAIPNKDDYGSVDASVTAGDINSGVFGKATGGLFRSFKWNGPGKYSLRIHLRAGDVNLVAAETI